MEFWHVTESSAGSHILPLLSCAELSSTALATNLSIGRLSILSAGSTGKPLAPLHPLAASLSIVYQELLILPLLLRISRAYSLAASLPIVYQYLCLRIHW